MRAGASDDDGARRAALITGASAGIGRAFTEVFAGHGFDLVHSNGCRWKSHHQNAVKSTRDASNPRGT